MTRIIPLAGLILLLIRAASAAEREIPPPPFDHPVLLETATLRFALCVDDGRYEILDKQTGTIWNSNPLQARFGEIALIRNGKEVRLPLSRCETGKPGDALVVTFRPDAAHPDARVIVTISPEPDSPVLAISWKADKALAVRSIRLLDAALAVTAEEKGQALVPVRLGILVPSDSGIAFTRRFDTYAYEGCHMAMLGLVKSGATALLTWESPYVAVRLESRLDVKPVGSRQALLPSLDLSKSATSFRIRFCGPGDHVTIAQAYRETAKRAGWFVPWNEKLQGHRDRAKLFGAINYKLWSCLTRKMNLESTKEESVRVNWTFHEAAQVAEHLKSDLKLDRVLFTLGGWIRRGYDNQHPDILPAAPELGGDEALAACAKRVMGLGYLFCLHDNYQDMYRDAPSWDESYLMRRPDGRIAAGGHWAGGRAYLTCSKRALDLAKRPANLPAVRKLTRANAYFIDTTTAAGLQECFESGHPLSRRDDMKWKRALCDYARGIFGVFGSECGREWAIPQADFFEGLTGVSGRAYHDKKMPAAVGGVVVPLFELVYRDTIALHGKYGYAPERAAGYVLRHALIGRTLHHHNVPAHLYWKEPVPDAVTAWPVAEVEPTGPRTFRIAYRWTVERRPARNWRAFVHFCDERDAIAFQNDHAPDPPTSAWAPGEVRLGPFTVNVPDNLSGDFQVRLGLYEPDGDRRARFVSGADAQHRIMLGTLSVSKRGISFKASAGAPSGPPPDAAFVRADGGWAEGLHPFDRFVKNAYEILSPLNELTSRVPMTRHDFLTPDRRVQKTVFGAGNGAYETIVNFGDRDYLHASKRGGDVQLPPFGLLIEGPSFAAFHAKSWAGHHYDAPVLFTLRSLDGRPLESSATIRVYHGFGDARILVGGKLRTVTREETVALKP
jgi:hypothetical protein